MVRFLLTVAILSALGAAVLGLAIGLYAALYGHVAPDAIRR